MQVPSKNYERAVQIYEDGGVNAIFDAITDGFLTHDGYRHCVPCELSMPHEGDTCLVCGTDNPPQPNQNQALDHKIFFKTASDCHLWLEENEIFNPVTLTIHLGD
jgi:hypothetical protein